MMATSSVSYRTGGLGHPCTDCGMNHWRVETFIEAIPADRLAADSGIRRWTCLACGSEYLHRVRTVTAERGAP